MPEGYSAVYVDWIEPHYGESLEQYALRLAESTVQTNEPFVLMGMSMGGMIAAELAKRLQPAMTLLISSVPVASELPFYFRWAARIGMHRWIPIALVKNASLVKRLFTAETENDKAMLRIIIRESDPAFIRWAMGAILQWRNETYPDRYVHIHGSRDEMLPVRFTHPTHLIRGAGHLMVMNRAEEINQILAEMLPLVPRGEAC